MEADAIFQGNTATIEVQMTESNSTFASSYEEQMTLIGPEGKSAYQIAVENGYKGTEKQWIESLKGASGTSGRDGVDGYTPKRGIDYYTDAEKEVFANEIIEVLNASIQKPKISYVTLLSPAWIGEGNLYQQVVTVEAVTKNSQVDLTPDVQQLAVFYEKDLTFLTRNKGGVVTVYAVGQKPLNDYAVQVTLTEVDVPDGTAIWGVTVGTPMNPESIAAKVEVDGELSPMSNNAVQNKAVATKFAEVETTIGNIDVLLGTI